MVFVAGVMLFVVMGEMIPEARRRIEHGSAKPALMVGLAFVTFPWGDCNQRRGKEFKDETGCRSRPRPTREPEHVESA